MSDWIKVKDKLPIDKILILCADKEGEMFLGIYNGWIVEGNFAISVEIPNRICGRYAYYWMSLPEPPK